MFFVLPELLYENDSLSQLKSIRDQFYSLIREKDREKKRSQENHQ